MEAKDIPDGLYLKIGDKLIKVDSIKDGKPVFKDGVTSEEIVNPDGTKNCTVHVPYIQIKGQVNSKENI